MSAMNFTSGEERLVYVKRGNSSRLDFAQYTNHGGGGANPNDWNVAARPNGHGEVRIKYTGTDLPGTNLQLTISVDNDQRCVNVCIVAHNQN